MGYAAEFKAQEIITKAKADRRVYHSFTVTVSDAEAGGRANKIQVAGMLNGFVLEKDETGDTVQRMDKFVKWLGKMGMVVKTRETELMYTVYHLFPDRPTILIGDVSSRRTE